MKKFLVVICLFIILSLSASCAGSGIGLQATETPAATALPKTDYSNKKSSDKPEKENNRKADSSKFKVSEFHPIIFNDMLLGGSKDGAWFYAYELSEHIDGSELYKLYDLNGEIGEGFGGTVIPDDPNYFEPYTEFISIENLEFYAERSDEESDFIAVSCDWDCMPRKASTQSLTSEAYSEIVKSVLAENGLILDSVNIVQNYRVDFEGDGVDEVVIYAESPSDGWKFNVEEGTYSLLFLRKIVDGEVRNFILHKDIHTNTENYDYESGDYRIRYTSGICGFFDLDGDGELELIIKWQYYEGFSYFVYKINRDSSQIVLENGCGA